MNVRYLHPLGTAWGRARAQLFSPLRAETWISLGFCAWLAGLVDLVSLVNQAGFTVSRDEEEGWSVGGIPGLLSDTWPRVFAGGAVLYLAIMVGLVLFAFWLALVWVSARGKFMFLDNVVRGRWEVAEPWRRHARLADSLFLWQVGLGLATLVVVVAAVLAVTGLVVPTFVMSDDPGSRIAVVAAAAVLFGLLGLAGAFLGVLTEGFVVPVMYRHRCGVLEAWRRFLPLLRANLGEFLLYGLLVLVLWILYTLAVLVVGFSTCCMGFVILAAPYVGTLALLPIHVTYRAFSLEFLAQFGEEYAVPGGGSRSTPTS